MNKDLQGSYEDCRQIYDSLSEKEQMFMGSGRFVNSPYVVFRRVIYNKGISTGFIQLYDMHFGYDEKEGEYHGSDVNIGLAIRPEYRGKGLGSKLLEMTIEWFKQSQYRTMSYIVNNENESSIRLVEKHKEFKRETNISPETKEKNERVYIMKQPQKRNKLNLKPIKKEGDIMKERRIDLGNGIVFIDEEVKEPIKIKKPKHSKISEEDQKKYKKEVEAFHDWAERSRKNAKNARS